jgi:D-glycero-D-manno-heptose 1,7-bisphosphate phosphatase
MNKAVIFDRDGTINLDTGYVFKKEDFVFMDTVIDAILLLNNYYFKVIVITNQSGVARGYFNTSDVEDLHLFINSELKKYDAGIDQFYYCPHIEEDDCNCRKPKDGLFKRAIHDFDLDVKQSYSIGDNIRDIIPAKNLGFKTILFDGNRSLKEIVDEIVRCTL